MPKIKSITINLPIDTISFNQCKITDIDKLDKDQLQALQSLAIIDGDVEYEKPTILKRPDGSVISELEENTIVLEICLEDGIPWKKHFTFCKVDKTALMQGLIFLPKDLYLAEKKAKMLTKQLEIQYEIDRLNAKEEDKSVQNLSFVLYMDYGVEATHTPYTGQTKMSKKTAETILEKYSQDELKNYLGIII